MKDDKWHSGPPPSIGWWPASRYGNDGIYRWWDGCNWSMAASRHCDVSKAAKQARTRTYVSSSASSIKWKHRPDSWPERSKT